MSISTANKLNEIGGEITNNLKDYRIAVGLNQQEAAKKIGVSQATICMWETKKTLPHISKVYVIAHTYNRSIDEITKAIMGEE